MKYPLVAAASLLVACTDPRARPVPPIAEVQFAASFRLTSPGRILGAIYLYDEDGLDSLRLSVLSDDLSFSGDSVFLFPFNAESTQPLNWNVPAGLAIGSQVRVVARVVDFAGFVSADTVRLTVQDSVSALR